MKFRVGCCRWTLVWSILAGAAVVTAAPPVEDSAADMARRYQQARTAGNSKEAEQLARELEERHPDDPLTKLVHESCQRAEEAARADESVVMVYQVADLVADPDSEKSLAHLQELEKLLREGVNPKSWGNEKGSGALTIHAKTLSLIIRQTRLNHERIAEVLTTMRRMRERQVGLDVRFLTVPASIGQNWKTIRILDPVEKLGWLELQKDEKQTHTLIVPRLTLDNGSTGEARTTLDLNLQPVSLALSLQPVVSADQKQIRLKYSIAEAPDDAGTDEKIFETVELADGGTVLIPLSQWSGMGQDRLFDPALLRQQGAPLDEPATGDELFVWISARVISTLHEEEQLLSELQSSP